MSRVSALFARKVIAAVDHAIDQHALLESIGLSPDHETDAAVMLSDTTYYELLERIAGLSDGAVDLPVRVGASMACDDYGAFGLAWKTAPNLRASFARAERYAQLLTSVVEYEVRREGSNAYFFLHRSGQQRPGLFMSNEATLASVTSISRQVASQDFSPIEVHFKHAPRGSTLSHEKYFGCPVNFQSEMDAILVSSDALSQPNRLGDEGISAFLLGFLDEELKKFGSEQSLPQKVKRVIAQLLSDGLPNMSDIARRFGLSQRTLHRRLGEEGITFQTLLDDARRELAMGLLVNSDYSLAEVSFLTGFSEQSAFNRAFKRWSEQTPASYRDIHNNR